MKQDPLKPVEKKKKLEREKAKRSEPVGKKTTWGRKRGCEAS